MEFTEEILGITLIPWQRWLLIHALELRPDGRFRFRTVLILVARQNGKTTLIETKNLWKLFVLGVPLIVGTAQDLDIAEESWDKALEIVEEIEELDAELDQVCKVNGKKFFKLRSGGRWKIKATSRRAGRGLSGDDVNLDELREHLTWDAWAAVTKTTLARANAQIFGFSNAGDDRSVVLNGLRRKALALAPEGPVELESMPAGLTEAEQEKFAAIADDSLGIFEWSAPADCDVWDRDAWAMANPSLGYTITEDALQAAAATDPEPVFRTESLCQHVTTMVPKWRTVRAADWSRCEDRDSRIPDTNGVALAVEVAYGGGASAVTVAGERDDGLRHVELAVHGPGTEWVVSTVAKIAADVEELCGEEPAVVVDPKGPAGPLIPDLEAAGLTVLQPDLAGVVAAYAGFVDGARREHDTVRHIGQGPLTAAVEAVGSRTVGDRLTWDRKSGAGVDVSPVVAASLALWGLDQDQDEQPFFAAWR